MRGSITLRHTGQVGAVVGKKRDGRRKEAESGGGRARGASARVTGEGGKGL